MKKLLISLMLILSCCNVTEAQTYANIPGPENVLVVYKMYSDVSDSVMEYYVNVRNIPASNIVPLFLPDTAITINNITHSVIIAEQGNIIRDELNHQWGTWYATQHAWKYFYQYIAAPIKEYIAVNNLNSIDPGSFGRDVANANRMI